ncbi:hypothetical protein ACHHYP_11274 [Achlya hypogyna]|uniref:Uncharacterized protein n=1 Tax=Achlya hypogyna TaxID=1202772 RepID=A0A1V9YJF6_ACHHY|nr:hypothetical protein ACHHYP_11274 [Achlya hypogyna]
MGRDQPRSFADSYVKIGGMASPPIEVTRPRRDKRKPTYKTQERKPPSTQPRAQPAGEADAAQTSDTTQDARPHTDAERGAQREATATNTVPSGEHREVWQFKTTSSTTFGPDADKPRLFANVVSGRQARQPNGATPELLAMYEYCKVPKPARIENWRSPTTYERKIPTCVLNGTLPLDCPPEFLYQILPSNKLILFWRHMRYNYGHVQFGAPPNANLQPSMSSAALCRLFAPKLANDPYAAGVCEALRRDIHTAWISDDGQLVILSFNSKAKAAKWRKATVTFRAVL